MSAKDWSDLLFYAALALCASPLFIVVFASTRALLRRFSLAQEHPKRTAALVEAGATPLLCMAGAYLALSLYLYYPHRNFTSTGWAADKMKRYEMVEHLQTSHQLVGLTKAQVAALLGTPDQQADGYWEYYLGMTPKLIPIDADALTLEFREGKVVRCTVHET
ncbi:outer membrane protein assembly factor BamE [Hymenobacter sp. DG01]|uniref:outer membrane protein assembly factor BamE n=1 Tax=Hymenobacter sp. DG01 TaxID=2584940 RepID=UPI00111D0E86|nr:outer membrane protein assembly factor BamE [Hymenobacter sp. DG01]